MTLTSGAGEARIPKVSVDYGLIALPGQDDTVTILAHRGSGSGEIAARVVRGKGRADATAASWMVRSL